MSNENPTVSRRDFLKLSGLLLATSTISTVLHTEEVNTPKFLYKNTDYYKIPTNQNKELNEKIYHEKDYEEILEYLKNNYHLETIFPPTSSDGTKNIPWSLDEIEIVKKTFDNLPKVLTKSSRFPLQLVLYKQVDTTNSRFNGLLEAGYGNRQITIKMSTNFNKNIYCKDLEKEIYENQENFLSGVIAHETAHSYLESDSAFFEDWKNKFGWYQNLSGVWCNLYPELIIHEANAEKFPEEDFAVSVSVFIHNPKMLDPGRFNYLQQKIFG